MSGILTEGKENSNLKPRGRVHLLKLGLLVSSSAIARRVGNNRVAIFVVGAIRSGRGSGSSIVLGNASSNSAWHFDKDISGSAWAGGAKYSFVEFE